MLVRTDSCDDERCAAALAAALESGRVEVHYQPVVVMATRQVVGFEALARIRAEDGTLRPPEEFVPAAETSGLIVPLGRHMLKTAVERAAQWRAGGSLIAAASVSVNVSPVQLDHDDVFELVRSCLRESGLPPSALILEITESTATSPSVRPVLERIAALGVRIALDDFGIGFATLDLLRRIPVQVLKLDRSFVAGVTHHGADRAIVRLVVDLADSLGLSVIAEGVETADQATTLRRLRCPAGQGRYFVDAGPDPEEAASIARGQDAAAASVSAAPGPRMWPPDVQTGLRCAARLLARPPDPHRGVVHAVTVALAYRSGVSDALARALGLLALVHDLRRLSIDGLTPPALAGEPRVEALLRNSDDDDVALIRCAVRIADAAVALDPAGGPEALAAALREEAARAGPGERGRALADLAQEPPQPTPVEEMLDDLDRRLVGRRGMEDRIRSMVGMLRVLGTSRDARELLRVALEEVRRITGAAVASLERWDRESGDLRALVNVGDLSSVEEVFPTDEAYPLAEWEQTRQTLLSGLPYIYTIDDSHAAPESVALLHRFGRYSAAAMPIYLEGRMWGQLWLATDHGEPPFSAQDIELLTGMATLMGGVVGQAENLDRMARLAFEDPLTRVGNRRAADDHLRALSARREPAVVALLDVDLLKVVNDTRGHAAGDEALILLADALSVEVAGRPGASVTRLGGDEFCVVLPGVDAEAAEDALRLVLARLVGTQGGPTVSVGVAQGSGAWSPRDVLAEADTRLQRSKAAARADRAQPQA